MEFLTQHEASVRLGVFAVALIVFVGAESLFPRKARTQKRGKRWLSNGLLVVLDTALLRILFPVLAAGVAVIASTKGWGLLNQFTLPNWLELLAAILVLDLLIYWQHRLFHIIPIFWRFHKVHHADRDIDASTALRFHPVEIVISMLYKISIVLILGPSVAAIILFEIILNASALFHHANIALPKKLDSILRQFIITPDYHRIHHSSQVIETNSNYGFFLTIWDHLFNSYTAEPKGGHVGMTIGLSEAQTEKPNQLIWSLLFPFRP